VTLFRLGALLDAREFRDRTAHDWSRCRLDTRDCHTGAAAGRSRMVAVRSFAAEQREAAGQVARMRARSWAMPQPSARSHTRRRQRRDLPEAQPDRPLRRAERRRGRRARSSRRRTGRVVPSRCEAARSRPAGWAVGRQHGVSTGSPAGRPPHRSDRRPRHGAAQRAPRRQAAYQPAEEKSPLTSEQMDRFGHSSASRTTGVTTAGPLCVRALARNGLDAPREECSLYGTGGSCEPGQV